MAIEARITPGGVQGGVEQVVVGLAHGFAKLTDGPEDYLFITNEDSAWLEPFVGGSCSIVPVRRAQSKTLRHFAANALPGVSRVWGAVRREVSARRGALPSSQIPRTDGTIERLGAQVVHFTMQAAYLTDVPSIYHPHDLQHLHYPEFFTREEILWRESHYRAFCAQASLVSVTTDWGKHDLIDQYALPADKIAVVPLAPAVASYRAVSPTEGALLLDGLGVTAPFAYYPAQTWPHKNHLRLLQAIHHARTVLGIDIRLVCSGLQNEHYGAIEGLIDELGLGDAVRFVGFVDPAAVRALYQSARMLVFPSLFEAAGGFGPIFEAFEIGTPVATSNATSLAEQAGDAAVVFDPGDVAGMARAIAMLWADDSLRTELIARGHARVRQFSWERVARTFRAYYRLIAGVPLTAADLELLAAPPHQERLRLNQ